MVAVASKSKLNLFSALFSLIEPISGLELSHTFELVSQISNATCQARLPDVSITNPSAQPSSEVFDSIGTVVISSLRQWKAS